MPIKRLLLLIAAFVAVTAAPAAAGEYPPPDDGIVVDDPTVDDGQVVQVTAECFQPGSTVTFTVEGESVGTAVADDDGVATIAYTVEPGSGDVVVTATGTGCDDEELVLGVTLTRNAAPAALPRTGSDSSLPMTRIAVSLLAVGALMTVFAARWRRSRATASI